MRNYQHQAKAHTYFTPEPEPGRDRVAGAFVEVVDETGLGIRPPELVVVVGIALARPFWLVPELPASNTE